MTVNRPDGRYTLFLNSTQPRVRHRFTVAHELAHMLLTPILGRKTVHIRRFSKHQDPFGDQIEYLCDDMASAMLMPSGRISQILDSHHQSARCVPKIAKSFDTSFEAASRRFVRLNRGRCGVIVWHRTISGAIGYLRSTIWNKSLGYCTIRLGEPDLSTSLQSLGGTRDGFISSKETIALIRGRGIRSTRQTIRHVTVESFARTSRGNPQCWSFIRLDH